MRIKIHAHELLIRLILRGKICWNFCWFCQVCFFFCFIILMFAETATHLIFCQLTVSLQREKHSGVSWQHPGYEVAKWAGWTSQSLQTNLKSLKWRVTSWQVALSKVKPSPAKFWIEKAANSKKKKKKVTVRGRDESFYDGSISIWRDHQCVQWINHPEPGWESKQLCIFTSDAWRGLSDTAVNKACLLIIMRVELQQIQARTWHHYPTTTIFSPSSTTQELTQRFSRVNLKLS